MVSIVNQLVQRETSGRTLATMLSIPNDVRRFIHRQIDDLNESDPRFPSAAVSLAANLKRFPRRRIEDEH
jgi:hypothetical protein